MIQVLCFLLGIVFSIWLGSNDVDIASLAGMQSRVKIADALRIDVLEGKLERLEKSINDCGCSTNGIDKTDTFKYE